MDRFLWISLGGAIGTGARYLVAQWAAQWFGAAFPFGTLVVNLTGSFLIAAVMQAAETVAWPSALRAAITIGFLGGFTTYSSFNYESTRLFQDGASGLAALNVALTLGGCFLAGWLGVAASRHLLAQ
jgi:CrcB protein